MRAELDNMTLCSAGKVGEGEGLWCSVRLSLGLRLMVERDRQGRQNAIEIGCRVEIAGEEGSKDGISGVMGVGSGSS